MEDPAKDRVPESSRTHYAHPTQVVPLCVVVGTMVPRNEPAVATSLPDQVTCRECQAAM